MIPAYHAVIDSYYADRHDDPQKFAIAEFDAAVAAHVARLRALPTR